MIWLDFDTNITAILRVIVGIMCILFYVYEIVTSNFMKKESNNKRLK